MPATIRATYMLMGQLELGIDTETVCNTQNCSTQTHKRLRAKYHEPAIFVCILQTSSPHCYTIKVWQRRHHTSQQCQCPLTVGCFPCHQLHMDFDLWNPKPYNLQNLPACPQEGNKKEFRQTQLGGKGGGGVYVKKP